MSEMIERVARTLANCAMEPFNDLTRPKFESDARAAVEAMREPTAEMQKAFYALDAVSTPTGSYAGWKAMIDEALK